MLTYHIIVCGNHRNSNVVTIIMVQRAHCDDRNGTGNIVTIIKGHREYGDNLKGMGYTGAILKGREHFDNPKGTRNIVTRS